MDSKELDELLAHLRSAGGVFKTLYLELTGEEDLDIESAARHYPLIALGLAAGLGVAAGWWLGRQSAPALPPPPPEPPAKRTRDLFEEFLPGAVDRVRARLPEVVVSDAAKARVGVWLGNVVERQFQQGADRWAERTDSRLGAFFRRATEPLDSEEEVRLEDPASPEAPTPDVPTSQEPTSQEPTSEEPLSGS
jgi:hypothetical protein